MCSQMHGLGRDRQWLKGRHSCLRRRQQLLGCYLAAPSVTS